MENIKQNRKIIFAIFIAFDIFLLLVVVWFYQGTQLQDETGQNQTISPTPSANEAVLDTVPPKLIFGTEGLYLENEIEESKQGIELIDVPKDKYQYLWLEQYVVVDNKAFLWMGTIPTGCLSIEECEDILTKLAETRLEYGGLWSVNFDTKETKKLVAPVSTKSAFPMTEVKFTQNGNNLETVIKTSDSGPEPEDTKIIIETLSIDLETNEITKK